MNKKYYIGIDIGTASCGVACCDENYNVLKVNNKHCLTSRIFDKAESCAARRLKRGQRRILERRAKRIHLLNEIFQDEIKERDPLFLERLKNSQLYLTDKEKENNGGNKEEKYKIYTLGKYTLFNDKDFNDKKFHKMFPTIYHLRKCLIDEKDVNHKFAISDIRLVYLACHHILKKRGNFLYEDMSEKDIENINIETEFNKLNEKIQEIDEDNDLFKRIDHKMIKYFCDQILNTKKTTNEFLNNFMQEFGLKKNDKEVFFLNIILNKKITKTDSKALFSETEKGKEIYFNNKYDSKIEDYTDNSDFRSIIDILYHISLKIFWKKIIKEKYISEVFIKEYQNHNNTRHRILSYLKEKNRQEDINLLFKGEEEGKNLYGHFVGKYLKDNKQERLDKKGIKVGENYEDPHDSLINGIKKVFKTDDQNANFTPPQSLKDIFYDG
jgi:CRISPR-associated endonuclease Csn1